MNMRAAFEVLGGLRREVDQSGESSHVTFALAAVISIVSNQWTGSGRFSFPSFYDLKDRNT